MSSQYVIGSSKSDNRVYISIQITKEQFDRLVDGHKNMWAKLKLGDECGPLNLVKEILHEAERVCVDE